MMPDVYAEQVLKQKWWTKQIEIARALVQHRRVLVKACHSIGKTHIGGGLVNWFFDCWNPGICITTAPTKRQVNDLMWKEVRSQRRGRPGLFPKAARMETSPEHYAAGFTAISDAAFQGAHEEFVFIIFDEAIGIDAAIWEAAEGMMTGGDNSLWLCIFNPTDTATRAYEEDFAGEFHVISVSALDHPNIAAELEGRPAPFPKAVRLGWLEKRVEKWCTPILATDRKAKDVEFPPGSNIWYRPGPLFEGRVLGRWPSSGSTSVWTEDLWDAANVYQPIPRRPLEIGCDVARFGDDFTSIVVRRGACALHHETHNGWDTGQTAGRLKQLAKEFCGPVEVPQKVAVKVDDDGVGGGVTDQAGGFNFVPVLGQSQAYEPDEYPNRRSELWFATSAMADRGAIDVSRLSAESKSLLRRQLMAPTWKIDAQGRRVVEPKDKTKERIGRSPDDADGFNLAYAPGGVVQYVASIMQ